MLFAVVLLLSSGSHIHTAYVADQCDQCTTRRPVLARTWTTRQDAQNWLNTHLSVSGIVTVRPSWL